MRKPFFVRREAKSLNEWACCGYRVHKGEKAAWFLGGVAQFDATQVYKPAEYHYRSSEAHDHDHGTDGGYWQDHCDSQGYDF